MRAYKIVSDDYFDYYTGKVKYEIGATLIHPDPDMTSNKPCGRGYHVSQKPYLALQYNRPGRLLEVRIKKENILGSDEFKMRVSELEVVRELNKNLVYGKNWRRVVKKIKRASNSKAYLTAVTPCPEKLLNEAIKRHTPFAGSILSGETKAFRSWDSARDAARAAVRDPAWDAALNSAWATARDFARDAARVAVWVAVWDAACATARVAAWDAARDFAWEIVRDLIPHPNPYEPIMDMWLSGCLVYFDSTKLVAAYVNKASE